MPTSVQSEFARQAEQMATAPAFHAHEVLKRLEKAVGSSPSDLVLDLACGPGIVTEAIAPRVRQTIGIDVTPEMVRLARERFAKAGLKNGLFSVAVAEGLPFGRGIFDQVVTRLSFHHFSDVIRVLSEIRRVVRPEGTLVVADVVSSEHADESALHNSLEKLRDPTHMRMFPRSELVDLINHAGFSVKTEESWQQERAFPEWAAIMADAARTGPLEHVMRALARAGQAAGISLREEDGELRFDHIWLMVVAKPA